MQNKKIVTLLVLTTALVWQFAGAQSTEAIMAYIARYKEVAISEMKRTGIPAAITLAQGIHETEAGTSELVRESNNHFGIKCKDDWSGETVSHDDDAKGECFRKYPAAEDSYKDHSDFLKSRSNYASLFKLDPEDYEGWAYGLKKAGYATNPRYAQALIKLIEEYHLEDYTLMALGKMDDSDDLARNDKGNGVIAVNNKENVVDYPTGEFKINETRVVYIREGTSYLTIAQQYEVPLAKLFEFNDIPQAEIADRDQLVFIQRKRKTGEHDSHVVQTGENLQSISQAEGIRLENLLDYNNLSGDMQPAVGETLYLRSKSPSTPKLFLKNLINNR